MTKKLSIALKKDKQEIFGNDDPPVEDKNATPDEQNFYENSIYKDKISTIVSNVMTHIQEFLDNDGLQIAEFLEYDDMDNYIQYVLSSDN